MTTVIIDISDCVLYGMWLLNLFIFFFFYSHRNVSVRKTTAQFLSLLAERMGASRLLSGAKDVTEKILPTAAQFVTDGGAETRYPVTLIYPDVSSKPNISQGTILLLNFLPSYNGCMY